VFVPPRLDAYTEASRKVFEVFDDTSPYVEGISIDEAFLDVAGLRRTAGDPVEVARRLKARVREAVDLPISVGVARTKHLAKVASAASKPDGLLHVPPDGEEAFLHPLPVERLWGVGPKTAARLHGRGIHTVGQIAELGEELLVAMFGRHGGRHLHALANNLDPRPVVVGRRRRSIGSQRAIGWRPKADAELDATLVGLVERVTGRMRKAGRVGRTVTLRLRFEDSARVTRSHTLPRPTSSTATVLEAARALLAGAMPLVHDRGCTLVGVSVGNLDDEGAVQLTLPFDRHADGALDAALDDLRERFGRGSVQRAVLLGRAAGVEVPLLPD